MERPNTISGLRAKRDELVKYREKLEGDIRTLVCDIDHLEAAIRIFDPDDTQESMRRYAAFHRSPRGHSTRFILSQLRETKGPLTSRQLADMWCEDRRLIANASTVTLLRKRMGATLKGLQNRGFVQQSGRIGGWIGWRLSD